MAQKNTVKRFAVGAVMAAVVGYVAGLLTAPKSGKETRQDIKDSVSKAEQQLQGLYGEVSDLAAQAAREGKKLSATAQVELEKLVQKASDSKDKAAELFDGVKDGSSEDKDLQKAIKDAQKAVDHLRDYLKK